LVYPNPSAVKSVKMNSDHSDEDIIAEPDPLGTIQAMDIDPATSKVLYVAAGNKESSSVFISHDSGQSWQKQAELPEVPRRLWIDPASPADTRTIYLAGQKNIAVVNGSQVQKQPLASDFNDISLGFQEGAKPILYATSQEGAFISKDGGASWQKIVLPGEGARVRAVATSLHHADVAYVSYNSLSLDGKKWM